MDVVVSLLRGLHLGALISLFGTLPFILAVLPTAPVSAAGRARHVLLRLARVSAGSALLIGLGWLVAETAVIAGADTIARTVHALPVVALRTQFGQWLLLRLVLLIPVLLIPRATGWPLIGAATLAGLALGVQPLLGHAGAVGGSSGAELIAAETLHLLAAGAWLGGLLPLLITIGILPREAAAAACRNFTPVGLAAVLLLAGTAVVQVAAFMGGLPGLLGTSYGHIATGKLGLFIVLLVLAALNRLVFTERLTQTTQLMRGSIAAEIALGTLVILTAGFLASRTPGTHEQPVWPFASQLGMTAFDDPDLRRELVIALIGAAFGIIVATIGFAWRRIRWFAIGAATLTLALSLPHLDLLFVAAYPTSFFTSPTEFAATGIVHGARLFATHCVVCHGVEGRGDGPAAKSLPVPPADLTAEHFRAHSDGELYWFIAHGFTRGDGETEMPGFGGTLSSEAIWHLIDYLHAQNAGDAMRRTGSWPIPVPMPQLDATCVNGQIIDLDDLRGRPLRLIADETPFANTEGITTILLRSAVEPTGTACIADEPQAWTALAIILGRSPQTLTGTQVLVDQNGWLRAVWRPGDREDWKDPRVLAAKLQDMAIHPIAGTPAGGHTHQH